MINSKDRIIKCISIVTLFFVGALKADAQQIELGVRYNPEFTSLINKNDNNAGNKLELTNNLRASMTGSDPLTVTGLADM